MRNTDMVAHEKTNLNIEESAVIEKAIKDMAKGGGK